MFDLVRGPRWPDGYDGRAISNDLVRRWAGHESELRERGAELKAEYEATAADDFSMRALWAGEGLDLIDRVEPAATIVEAIVATAVDRLAGAARLLGDGERTNRDR